LSEEVGGIHDGGVRLTGGPGHERPEEDSVVAEDGIVVALT
jgi:hypothetical protein